MGQKKRSSIPRFRLPEGADPRRSGPSRPVQVGDALRQALAELLAEGTLKDPRLSGVMVTITDVEMSPDLRLARVFFSLFPSDDPAVVKGVWKALAAGRGELKRHLGPRLSLRFVPDLEVRLDPSVAEGAKIETILREIRDSERDPDLP